MSYGESAPSPLLPELTPEQVEQGNEIPRIEVRLYWISDYWDGALEGMLLYRGEKCWFSAIPPIKGSYRTMAVFRLSEQQMREEEELQTLYRRHIGSGSVFGDSINGKRTAVDPRPAEGESKFDEVASLRQPLDLRSNEILGWWKG